MSAVLQVQNISAAVMLQGMSAKDRTDFWEALHRIKRRVLAKTSGSYTYPVDLPESVRHTLLHLLTEEGFQPKFIGRTLHW